MLPQALPPSPPVVTREPSDMMNRLALRGITRSPEWGKIREYWEFLNQVPISGNGSGALEMSFSTWGNLDPVKADSIIAGLRRCGDALSSSCENEGIRAAVGNIIHLMETRALRLSRLNPTFLTRMIPPWTLVMREEALFDLGARLRQLELLRSAGGITDEVFASAMDTLFQRFETWALLGTVSDMYHFQGSYYPPGDTIMEIKMLYSALEEQVGEERLRSHDDMLPSLEFLLADLLEGFR